MVPEEEIRHTERSVIVDNYLHELGNYQHILHGYREIAADDGSEIEHFRVSEVEGQEEEMQEFLDDVDKVKETAKEEGCVPRSAVEALDQYKGLFEGITGQDADSIIRISEDMVEYQNRLSGEPERDSLEIGELLEPAEKGAERKGTANFDYNGMKENEVRADRGARLIIWTLNKNWKDHSLPEADNFNAEVSRDGDFYEIDIWDDGKGLFEDFETEEERLEEGAALFNSGDGHGLQMASDIAELYDGSVEYSEDRLQDQGFGVRLRLPAYDQKSTSDSA